MTPTEQSTEQNPQGIGNQLDCSICMEKIEHPEDNHLNPTEWLACRDDEHFHAERFHAACLIEALKINLRCPLCRAFTKKPEFIRQHFATIFDAVAAGELDAVEFFITENSENINIQDANNVTALMFAAHNGHNATVQLLLDCGAQINDSDIVSWTALMFAAHNGHNATVQLLLDRGANINDCDIYGITVLTASYISGRTETVKLLRTHGASWGVASLINKNPLKSALILSNPISISTTFGVGATAFATYKAYKSISYLIKRLTRNH